MRVNGVVDRIAMPRAGRSPAAAREANAARQVIRITTTSRGSANREMCAFALRRLPAISPLSVSELSASIRPSMRRDHGPKPRARGRRRRCAGAEPDAEVSFFTRDLTTSCEAKIAPRVSIDECSPRARRRSWDVQHGPKAPLITDAIPPDADGLRARAAR